jgi:RimJ/RimL family protein N-acetyltransferase
MDYTRYFWQGDRTRLRPLQVTDAEQSYADFLDSPSRRYLQLGTELPTSLESQREALARYAGCQDVDGVIVFAIEDHDGVPVGSLSYHTRHRKNGTFSFGVIVSAPYRGKGYATDAVRILLRYAFRERNYQKCNSACLHTNAASIGLHRKLGFVEEGRRRRQVYFDGQYHDEVLFGLTREEFDAAEKDAREAGGCQ